MSSNLQLSNSVIQFRFLKEQLRNAQEETIIAKSTVSKYKVKQSNQSLS